MSRLIPAVLCFVCSAGFGAEIPEGKEHTNSIGMKLVRIEAGAFIMGQGDGAPATRAEWATRDHDESPVHAVKVTQPFLMGAHEVTNLQYEAFDPDHKSFRGKGGASREDDAPVTHVTWNDAVAFCAWLSRKERRPYRLPTEAEWEYACRAGKNTLFSTGDEISAREANFGVLVEINREAAALPVGRYPANPWGLFDMHGNVEEWCLDWYGLYDAGEQSDPVGRDEGDARVSRGGSFTSRRVAETGQAPTRFIRSANRSGHLPEDATRYLGFRVVLGELSKTKPLPRAAPPLNQRDVKQAPAATIANIDAGKPYYRNFTGEKAIGTIPKETWGPFFSQWNHYAAVAVCPNGDVLATWYTCVSESGRELALGATRLRAGRDRWEPVSLFFDVPDMNDHAPVLLCDGKRIYHWCLQATRGWDGASIIMRTSDDSGATWSRPRIILARDDANALSQPCSAFIAADGAIVLACDGDNHKDEKLITSNDGGKTWRVRKGDLRKAAGAYAIHPAIAPGGAGSMIVFLRGPNPMPAFTSNDFGDTWSPLATPFPGIGTGQKATALRLASGALLLVSIDSRKTFVDNGGTFGALSLDDGKTWPHVRKIEGVTGYMSAAQDAGGVVHVFGTRMSAVAFNEAWLKDRSDRK
jgi:formylglycine-generating enzyme required for sulfatase activity